jgi:hypothetical protein
MQRPVRGYRGGIRIGPHFTHTHRIKDDDDDDNNCLSLSNSNSDDNNENDSTIKSKSSSTLSSITASADLESAIRDLRPLATRQEKIKTKPNISSQKADLPQLNMISDTTDNIIEQTNKKRSQYWFPKADIGHVDSTDFFRHNHIGIFINCFCR